uniref:SANTA domain-containing protein n=1 Tax=Mesocestoides corti TaxID=53468 RepID=A0A5K3FBP0_MESCO
MSSNMPPIFFPYPPFIYPSPQIYYGSPGPSLTPPMSYLMGNNYRPYLPGMNATNHQNAVTPVSPQSFPQEPLPPSTDNEAESNLKEYEQFGPSNIVEWSGQRASVSSNSSSSIIHLRDWIPVALERHGGCRVAGRHVASGRLVHSGVINFVGDTGHVVSDGKDHFKLSGPISWEFYKLVYPQVRQLKVPQRINEAFSSGFPQNWRHWMRSLYRFLYQLVEDHGKTLDSSAQDCDLDYALGIREMCNRMEDCVQLCNRSFSQESAPSTVLPARRPTSPSLQSASSDEAESETIGHDSKDNNSDGDDGKYTLEKSPLKVPLLNLKRHFNGNKVAHPPSASNARPTRKPLAGHSLSRPSPALNHRLPKHNDVGVSSGQREDEPLPGVSVLCSPGSEGGEITTSFKSHLHSTSEIESVTAPSHAPSRADVGVQTSMLLDEESSIASRPSSKPVILRNAKCGPSRPASPSSPRERARQSRHLTHRSTTDLSPRLRLRQISMKHSKSRHIARCGNKNALDENRADRSHRRGAARTTNSANSTSSDQSDSFVDLTTDATAVVRSSKSKPITKGSTSTPHDRHRKNTPLKSASASTGTGSDKKVKRHKPKSSDLKKHHISKRHREKLRNLNDKHILVTQTGLVDVRTLRRTRYGRLSVPTRDKWHRQDIVFNGADISVNHGEYGKFFSSLLNE